MIEEILPGWVVVAEAQGDRIETALFEQEEKLIANAVEKRRREFATSRGCARAALAGLGLAPMPIPTGQGGEPIWPEGVIGSITHCEGYRACAVARASDGASLGIDAEPHAPLPRGVEGAIAHSQELHRLCELRARAPHIHWDRLLFSAKESIYKAWFPSAKRPLGFEDATVSFDPDESTFSAELASVRDRDRSSRVLSGRWLVRGGYVFTAIAHSQAR